MKRSLPLVMIAIFVLEVPLCATEAAAKEREIWYDWQGKAVAERAADHRSQLQAHDLAAAPQLTKYVSSPLQTGRYRHRSAASYFYQPYPRWYGSSCYPSYHGHSAQPRFFLWYSSQNGWGVTGH